ncbi:MAG: IS110 family transposase, partial [Anaerolineae bacterium]|nr:IS110 family transposase [Anaerolineae bacterium]
IRPKYFAKEQKLNNSSNRCSNSLGISVKSYQFLVISCQKNNYPELKTENYKSGNFCKLPNSLKCWAYLIFNPKLRGQLAKTDAIDALILMEFAQFCHPQAWTPPPVICETLRQVLIYRQQLIDMQTQVRNQIHAFQLIPHADRTILQSMTQRLDDFSSEIKQLHDQIATILASDHPWHQACRHLLSIPGISSISAAWLLVATHCFERCDSPQQAASFAGLAPHPKDSGDQHGQRFVGGIGHQNLRNTLYMASAAASRFNPILKAFYQRLVARGKPKKVARCAVARKLIHLAWACVTKQQDFDPNYLEQPQLA